MNSSVTNIRNFCTGSLYRFLLKPVFFLFDPETVHDRILALGKSLGANSFGRAVLRLALDSRHPELEITVAGIKFSNPVGLAAGFDKNGLLTDTLPAVGFGFTEIGSVTGEVCPGNERPRLWRLPKTGSLLVYYGLKNNGAEEISSRLRQKQFAIPVGVSVAKTNSPVTAEASAAIRDYIKALKSFVGIASYFTVNISCPNAFGGQPFTDPKLLDALLKEVDAARQNIPVFIKLSADLTEKEMDAIIGVANQHQIAGFICTNLTKNHAIADPADGNLPSKGGLSGRAVQKLSDEMIRYIRRKTGDKYIIMGCGGIFSADDAYRKIRAGASLVQLITGMIYQGPQLISEIKTGLVDLLRKDGFTNISEAVGADYKS